MNEVGMMMPVQLDAIIGRARDWDEFLANLRNSGGAKAAFERGVKEARSIESRQDCGPGPDQAIRTELLSYFEGPAEEDGQGTAPNPR